MTITVNGSTVDVAEHATVVDAVTTVGKSDADRGIAVAVNGEVVPRREWRETRLTDGDKVEVLTAVAGG